MSFISKLCEEYIKQMNRELLIVRNDLEEYEMVFGDVG